MSLDDTSLHMGQRGMLCACRTAAGGSIYIKSHQRAIMRRHWDLVMGRKRPCAFSRATVELAPL